MAVDLSRTYVTFSPLFAFFVSVNFILQGCDMQKSEALMGSTSCKLPIDSESIWEAHDGPFQSCKKPHPYPQDGASMCAGDPTSFSLDLSTVPESVNCYVWTAPQCKFKWADVRTLQFDVEWSECDGVWFAPLWANPSKWEHPQWKTGEIDFVESPPCPGIYSKTRTKVGTSLNCKYSKYGPAPADTQCADTTTDLDYGDGSSSKGPQRLMLTLTDGTLETQICKLVNGEASQCKRSSYFKDFLTQTVAGQENLDMTFISDVWNGRESDQDCSGDPEHFRPNSQCKYTVWNMKVEGPKFSGKCAALNDR